MAGTVAFDCDVQVRLQAIKVRLTLERFVELLESVPKGNQFRQTNNGATCFDFGPRSFDTRSHPQPIPIPVVSRGWKFAAMHPEAKVNKLEIRLDPIRSELLPH